MDLRKKKKQQPEKLVISCLKYVTGVSQELMCARSDFQQFLMHCVSHFRPSWKDWSLNFFYKYQYLLILREPYCSMALCLKADWTIDFFFIQRKCKIKQNNAH
ncbi:hypothetical protein EGW08_006333 [Elysia chlorotica]|uniref:Uncharacterized protein n=1 Tax=Elysia chlorotica TaxID=188477 RepID=A0A3S1BPZ0_ELYCH|nr:hypothetical protein EGW08_006333 [Elysia chlorotica]